MTFDAGGNDAIMQKAQAMALAEARRIRNWTYQKEIGDDWVGELVTTDEVPPIDEIDRGFVLTGHKDRMKRGPVGASKVLQATSKGGSKGILRSDGN